MLLYPDGANNNNYHVIAHKDCAAKIGDVIEYEPTGVNFGFLVNFKNAVQFRGFKLTEDERVYYLDERFRVKSSAVANLEKEAQYRELTQLETQVLFQYIQEQTERIQNLTPLR